MRARLVALEGQADICLDRPLILVGRHRGCDVRMNSPQVSRYHCCIAWQDGEYEVRDLGSTNGIRINGHRLEAGRLRPGDELTIARLRFLLTVGSTPAIAPPAPAPAPGPGPEQATTPALDTDSDTGHHHGGGRAWEPPRPSLGAWIL
jgi:predicted component of type VI protein secretion system